MTRARWFLLAAIPLLAAAAPASVPDLDIRTTCTSRGTQDQGDSQGCLRSERGARDELAKGWSKIPPSIRETCLSEVKIGGSPSYVELLTCAQMNEWSSAGDAKAAAKGDAKRR